MIRYYIFIIFLVLVPFLGFGQAADIPAEYQLMYSQDFEKGKKIKGFEMTDTKAWKLHTEENGNKCLELIGGSEYKNRVRSPFNIAMIEDLSFGSFVLEVDLLQTGREYGHRDLCLFFSMKDPSNFYYIHMASIADPHAHNIFLVNDEARVAIANKTTKGIQWGESQWHKVRIVRNIESGIIRLYYDDMNTPIMEAEDKHFEYGHIGLGSFDDSGRYDNIKIWAPSLAPEKKGFFK